MNKHNKKQPKISHTYTTTAGQCTPFYTSRSLCCQQVLKTITFCLLLFSKTTATSSQTRETFTIFTYLLECTICKTQNVGKSETSFNIRLNNHRKYFKKPNGIEACKHFNNNEHTFSKHGKFIIIEQLRNINTTPTETLKLRLKERENFWIKKLKTLTPYGLNQELN